MTTIEQVDAELREAGHVMMLDRLALHVVGALRAYALRALDDLAGRLHERAQRVAVMREARAVEAARLRAVLDRAVPPPAMAAAPVAPARGPMQLVVDRVDTDNGYYLHSEVSLFWRGMDQLSIMCRQAYLAHEARDVGAPFVPPFTPGQIAMGQHYAALVERHDGAGVKCASLEGRGGGGGNGGGFADAYLAEGREIAAIRRRIGDGVALAVRRIRPSDRGSRAGITDRRLVDMVCLAGADLTAVLRAHGWVKSTANLQAVRGALVAALDRMQGYREKGY